MSAIFCPSTSLCVAGDGDGNIITSTDPTGGQGAWTSIPVDITGCASPQSTPCIAEQLYAQDDNGSRLIDSAPPGSGNVIDNLSLSGDSLTLSWTHNSEQRQLQLR